MKNYSVEHAVKDEQTGKENCMASNDNAVKEDGQSFRYI